MKWLRRKLLAWIQAAQVEEIALNFPPKQTGSAYRTKLLYDHDVIASHDNSNEIDMGKAIRFAVLPARGGCVLEIKTWDKNTNSWETISHVIPEGEDVANAVGKLVAMEILRR